MCLRTWSKAAHKQKQQMKHRPTGTIYHPIQITMVHTYKTYKYRIVPTMKKIAIVLNGSKILAMAVAA
jgi:hypothetical protein